MEEQLNDILFLSRHILTDTEEKLLQNKHGKNVRIFQKKDRFGNYDEFQKLLKDYKDGFTIYLVIKYKWLRRALREGYTFGQIIQRKKFKEGVLTATYRLEYYSSIQDFFKKKNRRRGTFNNVPKPKTKKKRKKHPRKTQHFKNKH